MSRFIIRVIAAAPVPTGFEILKILATEQEPVGPGTNTRLVYICLAEQEN